jgi:hypothetical protein
MEYYILTVQRDGNFSTIWYEGFINKFLLIERTLGRTTNIIYSLQITEEEYESARIFMKERKK